MYVAVEENELGNLEIWKVSQQKSGNLEIRKLGNLEIWKVGLTKIWKCGNLES